MYRELEKHLDQAKQRAEEELEATGGSKVRFSVEGKQSRQSLQAASSINSLYDCGQSYLSLLTFYTRIYHLFCRKY